MQSKPESLLEDEENAHSTDTQHRVGGAFSVDTPSSLPDENIDLATAIDRATAAPHSDRSAVSTTNLIDVQEDPFDPRS